MHIGYFLDFTVGLLSYYRAKEFLKTNFYNLNIL